MILHAFWQPDSGVMSFWGEDDGRSGSVRAGQHPADTPFRRLVRALPTELDMYREIRDLVWPAVDGVPVASTEPVPAAAALCSWTVTVGESISDCAVDVLLRLPGSTNPEVVWGASLWYWRRLLEFSLWLFDMRLYVPGISRFEEREYPTWQAMYAREAEDCWRRLVAAMPPVCRAVDALGGRRPEDLVVSFVDAAVDSLVRHRVLRRNPTFRAPPKRTPPLHRQWLEHLKKGHLGPLRGDPGQVERFAGSVMTWLRPLRPMRRDMAFRLGFRLLAPEREDDSWRLDLFVRAMRAPRVQFSAEAVWLGQGAVTRHSPAVQEVLLRDLARCRQIFAPLGRCLKQCQPTHCTLSRAEAVDFLVRVGAELNTRGYPSEQPAWLCQRESQLGLRLQLRSIDGGADGRLPAVGMQQLVAFDWQIAIGDQTVTVGELRRLAAAGQPFVRRAGKWVHVDVETARRSVELLDGGAMSGEMPLTAAMGKLLQLSSAGGLPVVDLQAEGELARLFQALEGPGSMCELPTPPGFHGRLRRYQLTGFSWLTYMCDLGFGACLADDMGLGKTIQLIALLLQRRARGQAEGPALIVCPMSVVGNWRRELARFSPDVTAMVHHGVDRDRPKAFAANAARHDVVITTYALVVRDHLAFQRRRWDLLILDEAQNIKNPRTKQAAAIRSLNGNGRICLTGTPVENRLTELWSLMEFLNPGYLGSNAAFRRSFAVPIERDRDAARAELLSRVIQPFILRRLKSDRNVIRDLPRKQEMKVYCSLTKEQAALYQRVVDEMLAHVEQRSPGERRGVVLASLMKLKQVTNHPAHYSWDDRGLASSRSGKQQRLEAMLDVILAEGDKALIFTQFAEYGRLLQPKLEQLFGVEVLFMHGGSPQTKREEMVERFQRRSGPPLFLLTLKTGGAGLNLTAASHVFHFDRWWNPAVEDQATDRAYRIGQTRNVQVHKFVCAGTVEERIDQMIEKKKALAAHIIGSGEAWLSDLSTDELRDVFALSREAVIE